MRVMDSEQAIYRDCESENGQPSKLIFNPNLPNPVNFVPFDTMRY